MFRRSILVVVLAAVCAGFCQSNNNAQISKRSVKTSGIKGTVVLTGNCPGPQRVDQPCPRQPYKGELAVRRSSDQHVVATAKTDGNGEFRVVVPPGAYFITQAGEARYPMIHSPEIIVLKNKFTTVKIEGDLGMR